MKVRFYCDVPNYAVSPQYLYANTAPSSNTPEGWKRVAFDVDFPPEVIREFDVKAPVEYKGVV